VKADVTVVVGTFGERANGEKWKQLAKLAVKSAYDQSLPPTEVIHQHAANLAQARNTGASMASTRWLIFLDADDTLDREYVRSMMEPGVDAGVATLRQPSTLGVYQDGTTDSQSNVIKGLLSDPYESLRVSNFMVIGTMCERAAVLDVGGFDPTLPVLEDWDLWIRLVNDGAKIGVRPDAIYRVGVNPGSRNTHEQHGSFYNTIRRKCEF